MSWSLVLLVASAPFIGSFLGVVVDRLPHDRSIVRPRSACDHCAVPLGACDLIPLVSWIALRGRCRHCGAPIDPLYPALELSALIVAIWSLVVVPSWLAWPTAVLGFALIALSAIDFRHLLLPDQITLPLVPFGLAIALWIDARPIWVYAFAAAAAFAVIAGLRSAYAYLRKREGLGLGDAKLMAAAGAWVGLEGLASVILLAAIFGLAYHFVHVRLGPGEDENPEIPFGPWISAAFWLTWLYGPLHLV